MAAFGKPIILIVAIPSKTRPWIAILLGIDIHIRRLKGMQPCVDVETRESRRDLVANWSLDADRRVPLHLLTIIAAASPSPYSAVMDSRQHPSCEHATHEANISLCTRRFYRT